LVRLGRASPDEYELSSGSTSIGSSADNDLVIADDTVASHHARIIQLGIGRSVIEDLGSGANTLINGARVKKAAKVRGGDEVQFGEVLFVFLYPKGIAHRKRIQALALEISLFLFVLLLLAISQINFLGWFGRASRRGSQSAPTPVTQTIR
jgi:pSer/pThr/pTyr-binding forkhead associated (FHA) protein